MGRPRKTELELPECVYYRNGKYYYVKHGRWYPLGSDRSRIEMNMKKVIFKGSSTHEELETFLRQRTSLLKARPHARSGRLKAVTITSDYVIDLAKKGGWHCAVTGVPLSLEAINGRRPYAPSIDRIDNAKDYAEGNVRVVCAAANIAMNVWGESVLWELATWMRRSKRYLDTEL